MSAKAKIRVALGLAAVVLLISGVVVGAAVTVAAGDNDLVHSCVNKNSGEIRIVRPSTSCRNNWTALDWSRGHQPQSGIVFVNGGDRVFLQSGEERIENVATLVVEAGEPGFVLLQATGTKLTCHHDNLGAELGIGLDETSYIASIKVFTNDRDTVSYAVSTVVEIDSGANTFYLNASVEETAPSL